MYWLLDKKYCYSHAQCNEKGYCQHGDCVCQPGYNYKHDCSVFGCKLRFI